MYYYILDRAARRRERVYVRQISAPAAPKRMIPAALVAHMLSPVSASSLGIAGAFGEDDEAGTDQTEMNPPVALELAI